MDQDDESNILKTQKATIAQISKNKTNNYDEVPEKSLGLRTKSILTQVSIRKNYITNLQRGNQKNIYFNVSFISKSYITSQLKYD